MANYLINLRLNNLQAEIDLLKSVDGLTNPLVPDVPLDANNNNIINVNELSGTAISGVTMTAGAGGFESSTGGLTLNTGDITVSTGKILTTTLESPGPLININSNVVAPDNDLLFENVIGTSTVKSSNLTVVDPDATFNTDRITLTNDSFGDPNRSGECSFLTLGVYNQNITGPLSTVLDTFYQAPAKSGIISNYNPGSSTIVIPTILTLTTPITLNDNTYTYFVPLFKLPFSYFASAYFNFYSVVATNFNFSVEWRVPNGTGQTELPMALVVFGNTLSSVGVIPMAWDDGQGITSSEEGDPVTNNYVKESVILQSSYLTTTGILSNGPVVGMLVQSNLGTYRNLVGYNRETLLSGISYEASVVSSSGVNTPIPST